MKLTARTLYGLESVLVAELQGLGAAETKVLNRAVAFTGSLETMYRVNYCSRTALSVLMPVGEFMISTARDLYREAMKINWPAFMNRDDTFSVVPVVKSKLFRHSGYPALVLKDAIADYFRQKYGKRPSVDPLDPVVLVNLHISHNRVTVSLDSSGEPLYKRGYRLFQGPAPMNEILAAGIVLLSGWNGSGPLLDPMCGSGTIPIEAGLIACKIPPGKFRKKYGFTRWKNYDSELFGRIKSDSETAVVKPDTVIRAGDMSPGAIAQCRSNIENAGLAGLIHTEVTDFINTKSAFSDGFIFINPPYGKRISVPEPDNIYGMIGSVLKNNYYGNKAWIIAPDRESLGKIGLRPEKKYKLFNGAIECILGAYDLYEGSAKKRGGNKHC
jgi:putative N6-adenine-specific DNA methylase